MPAQSETRRAVAAAAQTPASGRALWLGGAVFAVLAAGVIAAVATVQASRPLPFEAWARSDLMHRAGALQGASEAFDAALAGGGGDGSDGLGLPAQAPPGERDRAPSEIEIAALGKVLATAAEADELAANPPTPLLSAPTAVAEPHAEPRTGTAPGPAPKPKVATPTEQPVPPATPAPVVSFDLEAPAGTGGPLHLVPIGAAPAKVIAPQRDHATSATSPVVHDDFRVQLAALRDEGNVSYVWHDYLAAFGPLAHGLQRYVVRANTRSGVFHLVQIGPLGDLEHATSMCSEIRRRGHDCAVVHVSS